MHVSILAIDDTGYKSQNAKVCLVLKFGHAPYFQFFQVLTDGAKALNYSFTELTSHVFRVIQYKLIKPFLLVDESCKSTQSFVHHRHGKLSFADDDVCHWCVLKDVESFVGECTWLVLKLVEGVCDLLAIGSD